MKKREYLIVIIGSILFTGLFMVNAKTINAKQTIYDKIDVLVATNKGKAEMLYKVLGELKDYVGKKLGKKEQTVIRGGLDLTNVYGFDISKINLKDYEMSFLDERKGLSLLNDDELYMMDDYYNKYALLLSYKGNPISFQNGKDIITIRNNGNNFLYDAILKKYNDLIIGKISLQSKSFETVEYIDKDGKKDKYLGNIFNISPTFAQTNPMNQHFIKDNQGNIKGIGLYVFEGNGDVGSMELKYRIYSVIGKAIMEINIYLLEPNNDLINKQRDDELVIKNNDGSEKIDTDKFKNKYFKDGYFNDGIKSKEYWQEIKNKIDSYEELVKSS